MGKIISLLLVLLLALLSWWFQEDWQKPLLLTQPQDQHFPDYFMEDFTVIKMNPQGQLSHRIKARYMQHYNDTGEAQMQQPEITFEQDNVRWTISAQRAETHDNSSNIYLYDNVKIQRQNSQHQDDLNITTHYLEFNSQSRIAQTDKPAQIKTPDSELRATGMLIDYTQGILKLNSKVKGRYAPRHFAAH